MITYMKSKEFVDFEEASSERVKRLTPEAKALWDQMRLEVEAKNFRKLFGQRISQRREELGLNQRELANLATISQRDVSHIEQGKANPTLTTQVKLLGALGLKLDITSE
jgi:ribosome-binding protein aMBF1 (putative translation factor)